jgi:hypothetical protein
VTDRTVAPGQVWRHYKGGFYFIVAVAKHTETEEQFVIYRLTSASAEFWARPLAMFLSSVGEQMRFARVR